MRLSYLKSLKHLLQENNFDAMLLCPSEELKFLTRDSHRRGLDSRC